jgi:hypothetical protein
MKIYSYLLVVPILMVSASLVRADLVNDVASKPAANTSDSALVSSDEADAIAWRYEIEKGIQDANKATNTTAQQSGAQMRARQEPLMHKERLTSTLPDSVAVLPLGSNRLIIRYPSKQPARKLIGTDPDTGGWIHGIFRNAKAPQNGVAFYEEASFSINASKSSQKLAGTLSKDYLYSPPLNQRIILVNRVLGWRASDEEVIAFQFSQDYQSYRILANLQEQNALLWGRGWLRAALENPTVGFTPKDWDEDDRGNFRPDPFHPRSFASGDADRNKMLTLTGFFGKGDNPHAYAVESVDVFARRLIRSSTRPPEVGRLHGHVLVNALAQDGTPVPQWLAWGIAVLSTQEMLRANGFSEGSPFFQISTNEQAKQIITQKGVLSPKQWRELIAGLNSDSYPHFRVLHIEAQAQRMVRFFYARFGTGALVETLQRLGSGQSVDEALLATTGLDEEHFFAAWQAAEG